MVVVLPAPFGPRKPVTFPGATSNDRLLTATFSPYRLLSPRTSIIGCVLSGGAFGRRRRGPFSLLLRHCGSMNCELTIRWAAGGCCAGVQADRVARAVAAQPVPLAVDPRRAGTQHRAARGALRRLPRDDRGHVAVTVLARRHRAAGPPATRCTPAGLQSRFAPNGPGRSGPGPTIAPARRRASATWRASVPSVGWAAPCPSCRLLSMAARPAGRGRAGRPRPGWRSPGQRTCLRSTEFLRGLFGGCPERAAPTATTVS